MCERCKDLEFALHQISQHAVGTKGLIHVGTEMLLESAVGIARRALYEDKSKWTNGPHIDDLHEMPSHIWQSFDTEH